MAAALRLSLVYIAIFGGMGASVPYISVWFKAQGLSGAEIGLIQAAPMLARAVISPALAVWSDGFELRRTPILLLAGVAAIGYAALLATSGVVAWALCWFVAASCLSMLIPLHDVLTLRRAGKDGFAYSSVRGFGSLAYVAANVAMGVLLARAGASMVVIWSAAAALAAAAAAALQPREPVHDPGEKPSRGGRWRGVGALLADPVFMLTVLSVGVVQASHAFYYAFSTLIWRGQGIADQTIGVLWGLGVAVEVAFFWFMEPMRRRLGPGRLLILGAAAAVLRWGVMAFAPPLWVLFLLQPLHALTYAATFLASLVLIERLSPRSSASSAQTLSSALSSGILIGAATAASGGLFDRFGAMGYLAMAGLSALGLVGALRLQALRGVGTGLGSQNA